MANVRKTTEGTGGDINGDPWFWTNNTLDIILMGAHCVFWFFILFLIEADLGKRLRKCWQFCMKLSFPKVLVDNKLDSDVVAEAGRVSVTPKEQFRIKVENLRKVYSV